MFGFTRNQEVIDLKKQILELEGEVHKLDLSNFKKGMELSAFREGFNSQSSLLQTTQDNNQNNIEQIVELQEKIYDIEVARPARVAVLEEKEKEYEELKTKHKLLLVENETLDTENKIIKSVNKELSNLSTKVQPVLDENLSLKSKLENFEEYVKTKDSIISDLKKDITELKKTNDKLIDTITGFKTKDPVIAVPQVITPNINCNCSCDCK